MELNTYIRITSLKVEGVKYKNLCKTFKTSSDSYIMNDSILKAIYQVFLLYLRERVDPCQIQKVLNIQLSSTIFYFKTHRNNCIYFNQVPKPSSKIYEEIFLQIQHVIRPPNQPCKEFKTLFLVTDLS